MSYPQSQIAKWTGEIKKEYLDIAHLTDQELI